MKYKIVVTIILAQMFLPIISIATISTDPIVDLNSSSLLSSSVSWNRTAVPVCTQNGSQGEIKIISDGSGGAIIAWTDWRNDFYGDIYTQLIDEHGVPQWDTNGVAVCTAPYPQLSLDMCSDENGGVIITWEDQRSSPYDIYAQRIDATGNIYWDVNGVMIGNNDTYEFRPRICSDEMGGAIITWNSHHNDISSVYAQRIGAYGTLFWTSGGVEITMTNNDYIIDPEICVDNYGGAIIVWDDYRVDTYADIYGQRINNNGITQWTPNGKLICSVTNSQKFIKTYNHPSGGAFLAWVDFRDMSTTAPDIYAQRINLDGDTLWSANGVPVCTENDWQTNIELCLDYQGGLIITWEDDREDERHIYAQRIDAGGSIRWIQDGIRTCSASGTQNHQRICTNATNGIFITWNDIRGNIYAQKLTTDGKIVGNSNGYLICKSGYLQRDPDICLSKNGTVIIAWEDYRGPNGDIYAQRLNIEPYIPPEHNGIPFGNYYLLIFCLSITIIVIHIKRKTNININ